MDLSILYTMAENTVQAVTEKPVQPVVDEKGYSYVWAVVITGLSVVFLALIILILFVWGMGKIFSAIDKSKKAKAEAAKAAQAKQQDQKSIPAPKPAAKPVVQAASSADDDEVIAVIAAAVAAMGQAEGKNYKLKSVRESKNRSSRSAWSMAGLQSDTTPF